MENKLKLINEMAVDNGSKIVMLVMDGLGGLPLEPGGPTELEAARTPNMDALTARASLGMSDVVAGAWLGAIFGAYGFYYHTAETWWYLRFVLPAFPPLLIVAMVTLQAITRAAAPPATRRGRRALVWLAAAALEPLDGLCLHGLEQVQFAADLIGGRLSRQGRRAQL